MRAVLSVLLLSLLAAPLAAQASPAPAPTVGANFSARDIATSTPIPSAVISLRFPGSTQWLALQPTDADGFVAAPKSMLFIPGTRFDARAQDLNGRTAARGFLIPDMSCENVGYRWFTFTLYLKPPGPATVDESKPPIDHQTRLVYVGSIELPCTAGDKLADMLYVDGNPAGSAHVRRTGSNAIKNTVHLGNSLTLGTKSALMDAGLTITNESETDITAERTSEIDTTIGTPEKLPGMCGKVSVRVQLKRLRFEEQERVCQLQQWSGCSKWSEWQVVAQPTRDISTGYCLDYSELKPCDSKPTK